MPSNKDGGILNCPEFTDAAQANETVSLGVAVTRAAPWITTKVPGDPPLHVTITPWDRLMVEIPFMLVHTIGGGMVIDAVKGPILADPEPLLKVNVPPSFGINPLGSKPL